VAHKHHSHPERLCVVGEERGFNHIRSPCTINIIYRSFFVTYIIQGTVYQTWSTKIVQITSFVSMEMQTRAGIHSTDTYM